VSPPVSALSPPPVVEASPISPTPAQPAEFPGGYLPTLDGWRAVAITLVILAHVRFRLFGPDGLYPNETLDAEFSHYVIGVPLFFGISGILICSRLLEERRLRGSIDLAGFYVRRFFRILPPYFLVLAAIAGLAAVRGVDLAWSDLRACLLFYRNYVPGENEASWYTNHFWSLAVEEHFYLLLPFLLVAFRLRRVPAVLLALAGAVVVWRAVQRHTDVVSAEFRFLTYRTDLRIDGLLLGAAAAFVLSSPEARERLRGWLRPSVVVACLIALELSPWVDMPSIHTFIALMVPGVLLGTLLNPDCRLSRWLETAPMRWIGRMSYSLYLWQQIFLTPVRAPFSTKLVPTLVPEWMHRLPWSLAAIFACASASYYLVERPMTRIGRRLAKPATAGRAL
jgi:peptidoglycan/LPS O-acetylase OafA/YrhL